VVALEFLDTGDQGLGYLLSAMGVGGVVGAAAALALIGRKSLATSFGVSIVLWGAPIALMAAWTDQTGAIVLLAVVGLANTVVDVAGLTLLQRAVPDEVLARIFGILESLTLGTITSRAPPVSACAPTSRRSRSSGTSSSAPSPATRRARWPQTSSSARA